jgi:hypothetical protein
VIAKNPATPSEVLDSIMDDINMLDKSVNKASKTLSPLKSVYKDLSETLKKRV